MRDREGVTAGSCPGRWAPFGEWHHGLALGVGFSRCWRRPPLAPQRTNLWILSASSSNSSLAGRVGRHGRGAAAGAHPIGQVLRESFKGTMSLLALVTCASIMPAEKLPLASWQTAPGPGFLSDGFDNIPLTALARNQGGYDWGHLAYAMRFGGSTIGFSSSAGVALANMYPDAKSAARWRLHGWHVTVA